MKSYTLAVALAMLLSALYAERGFRELGTRKNYYEKPAEDAIIMTLFLK